ncbi:MAG: ankyrin repeat domain-containing protein [Candidatus Rifleibacteriota bacterium]
MWEKMLNAIRISDPILLGHYLNLEPSLVYDHDHQRRTLLHHAARSSNAATIFELLKKGARADIQDSHGWTPLHVACRTNNKAAVILFIESGMKLNITSQARETPLHIAARHNNSNISARLLAAGATANFSNACGNTPLHIAASSGFIATSKVLLTGKAEVNAKNFESCTPLHLSAIHKKLACAELLIRHNADPDLADKKERDFFDLTGICGKDIFIRHLHRLAGEEANSDLNFDTSNLKVESFFDSKYRPDIHPGLKNLIKSFVYGLICGQSRVQKWRTSKVIEAVLWFLVFPLLLYSLYAGFSTGTIPLLVSFNSRALSSSLGGSTQHLFNTLLVFLCSYALVSTEKENASYLYFLKNLRESIHFRVLHFALIELTFFHKLVFNPDFFKQFTIFWFCFVLLYSLSYLFWWGRIFLHNRKHFEKQFNDYILNT